MSRKIEYVVREKFKKRKGNEIYPNVDFYSQSIYCMMEIDPELFTPLFAVSRIGSWCAIIHACREKVKSSYGNLYVLLPEYYY